MLDFLDIRVRSLKSGTLEIYPEFVATMSKDLMIRGSSFYAIWDEERGFWTKNEMEAIQIIDNLLFEYAKTVDTAGNKKILLLREFSTNMLTEFQKFCKALPDNFQELDSKILFKNDDIKKEDYATRTLSYALSQGPCDSYNELISTLYDPEEKLKLEWAVGAIIAGDSKRIQKFIVLFGGPGTGKSTFLNIVKQLFEDYCSTIESQPLGSRNATFALEMFRTNPLIAIEHDGDLHRIEDNTKLNSIISHENMIINEKYKAPYTIVLKTFMLIGTNKPVKITDAKSGILRRLIDVNPTGDTVPYNRYNNLVDQIKFELGAIANHCLNVYRELGPSYYNSYIPKRMLGATNDMYNFIVENYDYFAKSEYITLNSAYIRYKEYVAEANVAYPFSKRVFKEELKSYFEDFKEKTKDKWNVYTGFLKYKVDYEALEEVPETSTWIKFENQPSLLDRVLKDCKAQYANEEGTPIKAWDKVTSKLAEIDTSKVHYVMAPDEHIVIDFDIKGDDGGKCLEKNIEAATKWPKTYAELSKSGQGIHLHYIYDGDVTELKRIYGKDIEIKVFTGKSSLRRCLTMCNNLPIAHLQCGLPLKPKGRNMVSDYTIKSEKDLRERIERNLRKEIHDHTKPSVDFIYKILEDAYNSDLKYDVRDMRSAVQSFAMNSSNQADTCLKLVSKMHFCSKDMLADVDGYEENMPIVFFDCEVFPNLFLVVAKKMGPDCRHMIYINPKPDELEPLTKMKLVGFNNRKYDNHILYARIMGYTEEQLFNLSQRIINKDKDAFFGAAYNLSYTDIHDFLSEKKSLKKWEIELGIHHQELGLPWDQPVPEEKWSQVAKYCCYDVDATEALFLSKIGQACWTARQILAKLSGLTVNDTTNSHTCQIIVGNNKNAQSKFIYTDLSKTFPGYRYSPYGIPEGEYNEGAKIVSGKSIYMGEDPSEGGYVYAEPGIYKNIAVLDIASMHPSSAIAMKVFGKEYTDRFQDIVQARILIKHKEFDKAKKILNGALAPFLEDESVAKDLAFALKIAINSVYGLTSAKFDNKLRDPRNVDNIVAKRGALFMITLKNEVQKMGYTVAHIKTDSIKIPDADEKIINFVSEFGKKYGYNFEHEATYAKMCLINDAVYIAKYDTAERCEKRYGYIPGDNFDHGGEWSATGDRFAVPYVFKRLFSGEDVLIDDLAETFSVTTALYLDMNENLPDVSEEENKLKTLKKELKNVTGLPEEADLKGMIRELEKEVAKGHDYHFVGRVGSFVPVVEGAGGGLLMRKGNNGKYSAATGTKKKGGKGDAWRWLETEQFKLLRLEDKLEWGYYEDLADDAIAQIEKFGDFEAFVFQDPINDPDFINIPENVEGEEVEFEEYMNEPDDIPFK